MQHRNAAKTSADAVDFYRARNYPMTCLKYSDPVRLETDRRSMTSTCSVHLADSPCFVVSCLCCFMSTVIGKCWKGETIQV